MYVFCPLRPCQWRTVDRTHLGTVVVVDGQEEDGRPRLRTRPAVDVIQEELREHLAAEHREELQLLLAGVDGGRGEPVVANLMQHLDVRQVEGAGDVVLSVLIPKMRASLAAELARKGLRPLDPWPAVQVRRYVWTTSPEWQAAMNSGDRPPGMRELELFELEDGRQPDLYQLELQTQAVRDTRTVRL
jgi:hypothetical protein